MGVWMNTLPWNGVDSTSPLRRAGRAEVTEGKERPGANQYHTSQQSSVSTASGLFILVQCLGFVSSREGKINISRPRVHMLFCGANPQRRESGVFGATASWWPRGPRLPLQLRALPLLRAAPRVASFL